MIMTWYELFNLKKYNPQMILSEGFIFSQFADAFPEISVFTNIEKFPISEQVETLDIDLFGEICDRYVSPNVLNMFKFIDSDYEAFKRFLISLINKNYYAKWCSIYRDFIFDYSLNKNYDLEEVRTISHTGTVTRKETNEGTESTITDSTVSDKGGDVTTTESKVTLDKSDSSTYGFNSSEPVPTDTISNTNSGNSNTTVDTDRTTSTDSDVVLTRDLTNEATDTYNTTDTEKITRLGDLSVRAVQELIQMDIDLWKKNVFYDIVMSDIMQLLCLSIMKGGE